MSKAKLKCLRCHSHKLNKFGKDKTGNQKYQCKECKRQFTQRGMPGTKLMKFNM